jgi:mRNA interferase MazF
MDLRPGEIVLIEVPFHQGHGSKIRPAAVVLDSGDEDFVAVPITSRVRVAEFDIELAHWQVAGLNVASTARIHKMAVLPKSSIRRRLGDLGPDDLIAFRQALCRAFCVGSE